MTNLETTIESLKNLTATELRQLPEAIQKQLKVIKQNLKAEKEVVITKMLNEVNEFGRRIYTNAEIAKKAKTNTTHVCAIRAKQIKELNNAG